jgi:type I restriction-modification system DNA methylase subunit
VTRAPSTRRALPRSLNCRRRPFICLSDAYLGDANQQKTHPDFILPLVFYKRLSDVYDDEVDQLSEQFGDRATANEIIAEDHADALRGGRPPIVRFYVPDGYSWQTIRNHGADGKLGEFVTEAMREVAKLNPDL